MATSLFDSGVALLFMVRPNMLKHGDKIGIVATAKKVSFEEIKTAMEVFQSWGLQVVPGKHLFDSENQFAGSDQNRLEDLQSFIDDPEVKAIICARGGYGTTRIIDSINFSPLLANPKWIIGFSDITALLFQLYNHNLESIHGIMAGLFYKENRAESIESLRKVLFGEELFFKADHHCLNKTGEAQGKIIGGNLSIICNLIGTSSDIDYKGIILFLEDLDEYLYHVDRMMVHLKRAGKLGVINGLIVGDMSDMNDNPIPFGKNAYEIIHSHVQDYLFPVGFGFPVGHEAANLAIPCGRQASLSVGKDGSILKFIE